MGEKTIIKIGGMTGTLCAQTIAKALSKLKGVLYRGQEKQSDGEASDHYGESI
ncbi:hypothetical protein ES703_29736 [subsurface metagenome]|jgi:copper chaperone CopZ